MSTNGGGDESGKGVDKAVRAKPAPIVYDLPEVRNVNAEFDATLEERRAAHKSRAQRFGVEEVPVKESAVLGARRAGARTGFVTGFDVTSEEEIARRERRAKRFGTVQELRDLPEAKASQTLEKRRNVAVGETIRENVLHVYGVDELSTKQILSHFKEYGPAWVEWLNDSSCNIAFEDAFSVRRVLKVMAVDGDGNEPLDKMGDEEGDGVSSAVAGSGTLPSELEWKQLLPVTARRTPIVLWMRMATVKDRRPERPNPKSKWSRSVSRTKRNASEAKPGRKSRRTRSRNSLEGVRPGVSKPSSARMLLDKPLSSS